MQFLKKHWGMKSIQAIAKALKRTESSIDHKARALGLGTIIDNSDCLTMQEVIRLTGLNKATVSVKWLQEGLISRKVGVYRMIDQSELARFMKQNPNRWDWRRCDESYFGRYKWFQEIKSADSNGFKRRKGMVTEYEIRQINSMREHGKTIREIAKWIDRPYFTVRAVLRRQRDRARWIRELTA